MRKLIHANFELDLSTFKISDTEENSWFSDSFFTRYSFPFEIDLTNDLDIALDFISEYNTNPQTYYDVYYMHNDQLELAVFEIEQMQEKLSATLRFGLEQLPNWDKKLSDLPLMNFDLPNGATIASFAETIITQTWPAVNYNFPMVHIDKISTDDDVWAFFKKIINHRVSGAFTTNSISTVGDYVITYNRNIMQPLPYFLYILQTGLADAGFQLSGDILKDEFLKKATLYGDVDYFKVFKLKNYQFLVRDINFISQTYVFTDFSGKMYYEVTRYIKFFLDDIGNYRIVGRNRFSVFFSGNHGHANVKFNGAVIYSVVASNPGWVEYNVIINYANLTDFIEIELTMYEGMPPDLNSEYRIEANVNPIQVYDENMEPITKIINENKVNLKKAVPDISFGDFIKVVKNWFNYDLTIVGNLAIMNPIEDEINFISAFDLSHLEVKNPIRKFSQGSSFILKFNDIESKDYSFLPVYQNYNTVLNSGYVANEKTTLIEINALPLPLLNRNNINTAYALDSNASKVFLVPYNGLTNSLNVSLPITSYLIPAVHLNYWQKWFAFRIKSVNFNWLFKSFTENLIGFEIKTKVFAYNQYHIIKTINRTEIEPDLFEIEIETESLK